MNDMLCEIFQFVQQLAMAVDKRSAENMHSRNPMSDTTLVSVTTQVNQLRFEQFSKILQDFSILIR